VDDERRKTARIPIAADVEFAVDHKILSAEGIDVSEGGIGFMTDEPLTFALTLNLDGKDFTKTARLVRVSQTEDGRFQFGLEFENKIIE